MFSANSAFRIYAIISAVVIQTLCLPDILSAKEESPIGKLFKERRAETQKKIEKRDLALDAKSPPTAKEAYANALEALKRDNQVS